ncbi:MAG: (d)CMP kinase [Erysipelotrichaceae bacterium]|nr:(d)CMP kinase [Erysipelotrichaceae bacterium]MBQ1512398.1 (d)CMP kinase [Erysipelotrichaceae bacterium]MBQ1809941.1 (d)CMP kinase [Erysipelotrichaceae bacterium]MBR3167794.1 (d)CMP kinase [Erysipelotrichaceae bacterium]
MKKINIAIDGPSAAGKSSIADRLAEELNYTHLDTGSMYRAVAYYVQSKGIALDDEETIVALLKETQIAVEPDGTIEIGDLRLKEELYGNEISLAASNVSKLKGVRARLVEIQQEIAEGKGYILDGRDIGTVVLPNAEVKIYLTASAEARAMRRTKQNLEKGIEADYEQILQEIIARDYQDTHRENSPLMQAEDAILVDSSDLDLEEVNAKIVAIIEERLMEND